jgi:hypothetical protein
MAVALSASVSIAALQPSYAAETFIAATDYSPPVVIDNTIAFIATAASELKSGRATTVVYVHPLDIRALDAAAFGDWEHAALTPPLRVAGSR